MSRKQINVSLPEPVHQELRERAQHLDVPTSAARLAAHLIEKGLRDMRPIPTQEKKP